MGRIRADHLLTAIAIAAVIAAIHTAQAPLRLDQHFVAHDIVAHLTYMDRFDHALGAGQFPVRWVEAAKPGYGQPLFNFYQPGFYYAVELVHLVVPNLSTAFKTTVIALWWLGAAFVFLRFLRLGVLPAALAALMFALSPYVIHDVFVRAALPEFAAIAFGAGVLWSVDRLLVTGRPIYVAAIGMLTGATLVCHLPAAMILALLVAIQTVPAWVHRQTDARRLAWAATGGALGLGVAAFYVLPAIGELHLIQIQDQTVGHFDFRGHFVSPLRWVGLSVTNPARVGPLHALAIALALGLVFSRVRRNGNGSQATGLAAFTAAIALALFMTTAASSVLWEAVRPLSFVQFPWRFMMVVAIATSGLAALLLARLTSRAGQALIVIGAAAALALLSRADVQRIMPEGPANELMQSLNLNDRGWRETLEARRVEFMEPSYDPAGVTVRPAQDIGRWSVANGEGAVATVSAVDHRLILDADSIGGITVAIHTAMFPGWTVRIDDREAPFDVNPRDQFIHVTVPPGKHIVAAVFENTPIRTAANAISAISLLLVVVIAARAASGRGRT